MSHSGRDTAPGGALSRNWCPQRISACTIGTAWVRSVIVADLAWVIGTVVLLAGWHELLSLAGIWMLIAIGAVVLVFGELQWLGLRRLQKAMPGT